MYCEVHSKSLKPVLKHTLSSQRCTINFSSFVSSLVSWPLILSSAKFCKFSRQLLECLIPEQPLDGKQGLVGEWRRNPEEEEKMSLGFSEFTHGLWSPGCSLLHYSYAVASLLSSSLKEKQVCHSWFLTNYLS